MKKNIFKLFLCVLTVVTVISAFAVVAYAEKVSETKGTCTVTYTDETKATVASVTGAKIYILNQTNINSVTGSYSYEYFNFGCDSTVYTTRTATADQLKSFYGTERTEYGLRYDLSEDGTLRIYAPDGASAATAISNASDKTKVLSFANGLMEYLQKTDDTYEGGYFKRNQVKKIVIDVAITRLHNMSFNSFTECLEAVIPSSLATLDQFSFGRMYKLKTIKVAGADYAGYNEEYVVDLRNVTSMNSMSFTNTFNGRSGVDIYPIQLLLSETVCASTSDMSSKWANGTTKGTFTVFTPTGESCKWISNIESRNTNITINVYKLGDTSAVSHLGYQIRTKGYNGLRAAFKFGAPKGYTVMKDGKMLEVPELIGGEAGSIKEYGVIVATEANADKMTLTKSGDEYVTGNAKVKKIAAEESKVDKDGKFFVTVTNFDGKDQMSTKICYVGYQVNEDGSIVYSSKLDPASLFDATIGSFEKGLVNSSSGDYDIFWDVLNNFKVDMKAQMWEEGALKSNIAARLKNETVYYPKEDTAADKPVNGCNGTDYTANFKFSATDDGDLVWAGRPNTLVSFIKKGNGDYAIMVHLKKSAYDAYLANPATVNYFESGKLTKNYVGESFLSTNFTGLAAKSLVIDDGITNISQDALKGFGSEKFDWFVGELGSRQPASVEYKGELETIIIPASVKTIGSNSSQSFHSNQNLKTVYHFGTSETGATEGLVDVSTILPVLTSDSDKAKAFTEWFNRARAMTALKLPESVDGYSIVLAGNFLMECKNLTAIYVGDKLVTNDDDSVQCKRALDLTGTSYSIFFDGTTIKTMNGVVPFGKITQPNGDVWTRANTWTTTWAKQ